MQRESGMTGAEVEGWRGGAHGVDGGELDSQVRREERRLGQILACRDHQDTTHGIKGLSTVAAQLQAKQVHGNVWSSCATGSLDDCQMSTCQNAGEELEDTQKDAGKQSGFET